MKAGSRTSLVVTLAALALATICIPGATAQPLTQKMRDATVAVYGTVQEDGKTVPVSRGGAFVVDARHVVTNTEACCDKSDKGVQAVPLVVFGGSAAASAAKVVWSSKETHMAILELDKPTSRPAVAIAPLKLTQKGQSVYTAQYPNPGDKGDVTITEGKLDTVGTPDNSSTQIYKTTAPMNQANAGGALFDACAEAMGMNITFKDGAQFAFVIDPLLDGLKAVGIQASVAGSGCGAGNTSAGGSGSGGGDGKGTTKPAGGPKVAAEWRLPRGNEWIPVSILVAVFGLAFRRNTRQQVARVLTQRRTTLPEPAPYPYNSPGAAAVPVAVPLPEGRPALRGIAGQYAGASIAVESGGSTLGRDPHAANLVFPYETDSVSKRHCTVRWDAPRRVFVLEDHGSTNGTFLASGVRLAPHQPYDLKPGDRFYIGDLRNQFEVGMTEERA
jgi:hypothetical protein